MKNKDDGISNPENDIVANPECSIQELLLSQIEPIQ